MALNSFRLLQWVSRAGCPRGRSEFLKWLSFKFAVGKVTLSRHLWFHPHNTELPGQIGKVGRCATVPPMQTCLHQQFFLT